MNCNFSYKMRKGFSFVSLMIVNLLAVSSALAQTAEGGAARPSLGGAFFQMLPMIACLLVVYHFMVIKPQRDEEKRHSGLLDSLKDGQIVVTTGGIIGRVAGSGKDYVLLDVGNRNKIKVEKDHIDKVREGE